jgi:hypothetical protein
VMWFEENTLPVVFFWFSLCLSFIQFFFSVLAPSIIGGMSLSPSANWQMQHAWVKAGFPFSGQSLCRWPPPHHKQRGVCVQLAQTWPNCWQLWHWVSPVWALYAFTLIEMWLSLGRWKISCNSVVLGKVVALSLEVERRVVIFWR